MTRLIILLAFISIFAFSRAGVAQIVIEIDGDASTIDLLNPGNGDITLNGNDFESYLLNNGFTYGLADADIDVTGPGTFSFELIGGRTSSGVTDSFIVGGQTAASVSGFQSFVQGNGVNGLAIGPTFYIPSAGQIDNNAFYFQTTASGQSGNQFDFFTENFATFVPNSNTLSGLSTVIFAFEDSNQTSDYDDLLIRASFTLDSASVPAPGSLGLLICGLAFIAYRQRRAAHFNPPSHTVKNS